MAHLFGEPAGSRRVEGELSLTPVLPRFAPLSGLPLPDRRSAQRAVSRNACAAIVDRRQGHRRIQARSEALRRARLPSQRAGARVRGRRRAQRRGAEQRHRLGRAVPGRRQARRRPRRSCSARSARQAHWLAVNQQLNPVAADRLTLEWVQRKFVSVLTQQNNGTFKYVSRLKEIVRDTRSRQHRRRAAAASRCRRRSRAISCWCCATRPAPS